jgi:hypothetical protein
MRILSATECISPAIDRTKLVLFTPFRKGRTWKLSATAYLATASGMFSAFPLLYLFYIPTARQHFGVWAVYALIAVVVFITVLYVFLFYLITRIKFAYFDVVLNRGQFVAPAWRKYGPQTGSWMVCKIALGIVFSLAISVPLESYMRHIIPLLASMQPGQPPPPNFFAAMFAGYGLLALATSTFAILSGLLGDFIVPSLALEDTGLKEAFRRMAELIRREPGEFFLYALLKTVLGGAAYFGAMLVFEIVLFIIVLIVGLIAGAIGFVLHLAGVPSALLIFLGIALATVVLLFLSIYGLLLAIGPILTFLDAYALCFLGGRYPVLGDLLDRSTPPPAYFPYPPGPPQDYPPQPPPLPASPF